jgi:L-ascorbate metabolism protein UlaG (beta-lactamase superfamily)
MIKNNILKKIGLFINLLIILGVIMKIDISGQEKILTKTKSRYLHGRFKNPYPGYKSRGLLDLLKWGIVDSILGKKPKKPKSYDFEVIENDGSFLRNNKDQFTVTWIGHSTLLIQIDGFNILTDPIWSDRASPVGFMGPKRHVKPGISLKDLPEIDFVIISHDHYDHLDKKTIKKLRNKPYYLVPLGTGRFFRKLHIDRYEEFDWHDSVKINGIEFICTPSQHFSGRRPFIVYNTLWCSWVIKGRENSFYFAGDTGYFPGFKEIGEFYGPFDAAALPIGSYQPQWFMGSVHLSPSEAVQAFTDLKGEVFVPIH